MIVPLVDERTWLQSLTQLPLWTPPSATTVVIAPHPDDETLGAGGLIASLRERGCEVLVIAVTDGENCYAGEDLRAVRPAEQEAALHRLGVEPSCIHRLHFPDSGLHTCEENLRESLRKLIPAGSHVISPWERDFHPDHEVCGRAAKAVAEEKSLQQTSYFFWTWHRGTPQTLQDVHPVRFAMNAAQQLKKREALACHKSQLAHESGEPILPLDLLEPAWRNFEVFLPA